MKDNFYREIFLKSKKEIDKKLAFLNDKERLFFLNTMLKNEILKSENEIRTAFNKIKCNNCGACCSLAISEFSPNTLSKKADSGDKTAASFLKTFTLYENNIPPKNLLPKGINIENSYFYHCKKVKFKNCKSFCPIYKTRPDVCKNFPDTPLENLPKTCAYIPWKEENETKALFIKALNDIRNFYLDEIKQGR